MIFPDSPIAWIIYGLIGFIIYLGFTDDTSKPPAQEHFDYKKQLKDNQK